MLDLDETTCHDLGIQSPLQIVREHYEKYRPAEALAAKAESDGLPSSLVVQSCSGATSKPIGTTYTLKRKSTDPEHSSVKKKRKKVVVEEEKNQQHESVVDVNDADRKTNDDADKPSTPARHTTTTAPTSITKTGQSVFETLVPPLLSCTFSPDTALITSDERDDILDATIPHDASPQLGLPSSDQTDIVGAISDKDETNSIEAHDADGNRESVDGKKDAMITDQDTPKHSPTVDKENNDADTLKQPDNDKLTKKLKKKKKERKDLARQQTRDNFREGEPTKPDKGKDKIDTAGKPRLQEQQELQRPQNKKAKQKQRQRKPKRNKVKSISIEEADPAVPAPPTVTHEDNGTSELSMDVLAGLPLLLKRLLWEFPEVGQTRSQPMTYIMDPFSRLSFN